MDELVEAVGIAAHGLGNELLVRRHVGRERPFLSRTKTVGVDGRPGSGEHRPDYSVAQVNLKRSFELTGLRVASPRPMTYNQWLSLVPNGMSRASIRNAEPEPLLQILARATDLTGLLADLHRRTVNATAGTRSVLLERNARSGYLQPTSSSDF